MKRRNLLITLAVLTIVCSASAVILARQAAPRTASHLSSGAAPFVLPTHSWAPVTPAPVYSLTPHSEVIGGAGRVAGKVIKTITPAPVKRVTRRPLPARSTSRPVRRSTPSQRSAYYRDCDAVKDAGAAPLHRGDAGYRSGLDRDHDGTACE